MVFRCLIDFPRGNVAAELDGRLVTPPESCGLLPGTLRAELLAGGALSEGVLTREDVRRATALWFFNGVRGMVAAKMAAFAPQTPLPSVQGLC